MEIDQKIIERYNVSSPRYTSYPPANVFNGEINHAGYLKELERSNSEDPPGLSLYVHVPFCKRICHFCGCNSQAGNNKAFIERYFKAMIREIDLVAKQIDNSRKVTQIHWGGGTPNAVRLNLVEEVMNRFRNHFTFHEDVEIAMECNPAYLDLNDVDQIKLMGFNRISLGIQDFNESVLRKINRVPSLLPVEVLVDHLRKNGFSGINLDFIYGLPGQTLEGYLDTLKKAVIVCPDRLVTFSYAHVPWVKQNQKILEKRGIPTAEQKMEMLIKGYDLLTGLGYQAIGMDHFALPGDEMARAYRTGTLHRNFQGYCTLEHTGQVYAFGASSITQLNNAYIQNVKDAKAYTETIEKGVLPVNKGYILNKEEKVIRRIINQLMCNGRVDFTLEADSLGMDPEALKQLLDYDPDRFLSMQEDGLVIADSFGIRTTHLGMILIRVIVKELDPNFSRYQKMFSKSI